jgi:hypothetical protein
MNNYKEMLNGITPAISDEALANAVMEKTRGIRRARVRAVSITAIVMAVLMGMTITAGAISDWDYPAVARFFFGGRQNVVDGMHNEINFVVDGLQNDFENVADIPITNYTIEVTGLYVDSKSILISMDFIADKPTFEVKGEASYQLIIPDDFHSNFLFNNSSNTWVSHNFSGIDVNVESEYVINVLYRLNHLSEEAEKGTVYTMVFSGINEWRGEINQNGENVYSRLIGTGETLIKFSIDKTASDNLVIVYPNVELDNGNVVTEIRIDPFKVTLFFDGIEDAGSEQLGEWIVVGEGPDAELHVAAALISLVHKDGSLTDFVRWGYSSLSDINTQTSWVRYEVTLDYEETLDASDIAAVIYKGNEILIG